MSPAEEIRSRGYCVLPGVINTETIDELRLAFVDQTSGHTEHVEVDATTPQADRWFSLVDLEPFHTIVVTLLGPDFETRIHGRNPRPGGGQQGLHADQPAGKRAPVDALTAIWMLDHFTADNGATRVVPESHLSGLAVPRNLAQPHQRHPAEVIVTGATGDVVVFDSHLWHSGQKNAGRGPRRSVQLFCRPTSRTLPGSAGGGSMKR